MERQRFVEACRELGLPLTEDQVDAFEEFEQKLYESNRVMNLTRVPREECWTRHFLDSLVFHSLIPPSSRVLDIGCGPGFPSWPLACARPDLKVTALDSSSKMIGFLRGRALPNLKAVCERAEDLESREHFDVVTGRAVAPLPAQLELSASQCKVHGLVLPMRSNSDEPLLEKSGASKLGLRLMTAMMPTVPETEVVRLVPVYEKFHATPQRYPRRWAEIKSHPLSGP